MAKRKGLSKRVRFEVFKRDKFTCQYCGGKAPDVVLQVDHIDPVAAGGGNEILNLITSCFDCNSGKKDKLLDDNSVIEKQRRQLELLQERREQIELMLEWKKSLATFDDDVVEMVAEYINSKIPPYSLNNTGRRNISGWVKKFSTERILDGIDEAAGKYLKYEGGELDQESVEIFINKVAGVIIVKEMPPIKQKLAYTKGIARNRFNYWDDKRGAIILNDYVKALEDHGWDEDQILNDLENEIIPRTKEAGNWTQWKTLLENWTKDVRNWEKPTSISARREEFNTDREITPEHWESSARYTQSFAKYRVAALVHLGTAFPHFSEAEFRDAVQRAILEFLRQLKGIYENSSNAGIDDFDFNFFEFIENQGLTGYFNPESDMDNYGMLENLSEAAQSLLFDTISNFDLTRTLYKRSDAEAILAIHLDMFEELCKGANGIGSL